MLNAIKEAHLDPSDFIWGEVRTDSQTIGLGHEPFMVPVLTHRPTSYGDESGDG